MSDTQQYDDLTDEELDALVDEAKPKRKWGRSLTAALLLVALVGAGFWSGAWYQKEHGATSASGLPTLGNFPGAAGPGSGANRTGATPPGGNGQFGGGGASGGATSGQVKLIDGKNVYVTTAGGSIVKVTTSDDVTVTRQAESTVPDIKPGDTVTIRGTNGSDGTVAATSISVGSR